MIVEIYPPSPLHAEDVTPAAASTGEASYRMRFYAESDRPVGPTFISKDKHGKVLARAIVRIDRNGKFYLQGIDEEIEPAADKVEAVKA